MESCDRQGVLGAQKTSPGQVRPPGAQTWLFGAVLAVGLLLGSPVRSRAAGLLPPHLQQQNSKGLRVPCSGALPPSHSPPSPSSVPLPGSDPSPRGAAG